MRKLAVAIGLIQQEEKYFLQFRDGDPKIGAAGLIGCFGGKIDSGEEPIDAICRELSEETSLRPQMHEVKLIGTVNVTSDHQLELVEVTAHVFHVPIEASIVIKTNEGGLVEITYTEAMESLEKMTPATRAVFEELLKDQE